MHPIRKPKTDLIVSFALLFLLVVGRTSDASVTCNTTSDCERVLRVGSTCDPVTGTCTNAFAGGCLRRMLGEDHPRRTCNSDDDGNGDGSGRRGRPRKCEPSKLDYEEFRVYNENWESAMFLAWIMQIWLSEFMEVPVTIETGAPDGSCSFYDEHNAFDYAVQAYNYDAHLEAQRVGDCRGTDKPCAQISMEVWLTNNRYKRAREEGNTEPSIDGNGMVGRIALFVPKLTAQRDPSLLSFYGLRGEENRRKIADTFKRPTTWLDYCREVSVSGCVADDGVASRLPNGAREEKSFFVGGEYIGHFRHTDDNNCGSSGTNPMTCTGHIADVPSCDWTTHTEAQLHWHNISLKSNGDVAPNSAYSYARMIQIWEAANATRSDVVMYWWYPDATYERFRGTEYEFQQVLLPQATRECLLARTTAEERCSEDPVVRRGRAEGGCDYEISPLQKYITTNLKTRTAAVPVASRSPAYDASKSFVMSSVDMEDILGRWALSEDKKIASDRYGHGAREVVCSWVAENLEYLEWLRPRGYPRVIKEEVGYNKNGTVAAAHAVAGLSTVMVLCACAATYHWRKKRVILWARVRFLMLTLFGFLLVSVAATVVVVEPSLASCTARQWLIMLGYSLSLVPLLVKVAAINRLMDGAVSMRRMQVSQRGLLREVAVAVAAVVAYLSVWTAIDPMTKQEERVLVDDSEGVVVVYQTCASSSDAWVLAALGWEVLLLLCAAVLAFQSRKVVQEFNESRLLAIMVYTHLLFFAVRALFYYLDSVEAQVRSVAISLLLSADTILNLAVYFGPKFLAAADLSWEPHPLGLARYVEKRRSRATDENVCSTVLKGRVQAQSWTDEVRP